MTGFNRRSILIFTIRSFFIRLFYNYSNLFGEGLCFCILPFFKKREDSRYAGEILKKHLVFFNASEYLSGFAIGIIINNELKEHNNDLDKIKKILSSTLGSIGDRLVYKLILPILVLVALNKFIILNFTINYCTIYVITGEIIIFNIFNFAIRYYGIKTGLEKGIESIKIFRTDTYKRILSYLNIFKIMLMTALILNMFIKVNILLFF